MSDELLERKTIQKTYIKNQNKIENYTRNTLKNNDSTSSNFSTRFAFQNSNNPLTKNLEKTKELDAIDKKVYNRKSGLASQEYKLNTKIKIINDNSNDQIRRIIKWEKNQLQQKRIKIMIYLKQNTSLKKSF